MFDGQGIVNKLTVSAGHPKCSTMEALVTNFRPNGLSVSGSCFRALLSLLVQMSEVNTQCRVSYQVCARSGLTNQIQFRTP